MLLGYALDYPNKDAYMLDNSNLSACANYSNIYNQEILNPSFNLKDSVDIFYTYDSFTIVSQKFKDFCIRENYLGIEFLKVDKYNGYYWFKINNICDYDTDRSGTQFLNYNENCDGYEEIIGANPICLKKNEVINDGFYRTNIFFGSNFSKNPLYMVGIETMNRLKLEGFKNIYFEKILDKYDWEK